MKKIFVLPGNDLERELIEQAVKIFQALSLPFEIEFSDFSLEYWQKEGNSLSQSTWDLIAGSALILGGSIKSSLEADAKRAFSKTGSYQNLNEDSPLLQLYQRLDLFANLRPCFNLKAQAKNFDLLIIHENTEGLSARFEESLAVQDYSIALKGLQRIYRFAFTEALRQGFNRVTLAKQAQMPPEKLAFEEVCFKAIAAEYPAIVADLIDVDRLAFALVNHPEAFGVIVADPSVANIFSALGAGMMGGLGVAHRAKIGENHAYFEALESNPSGVLQEKINPSAIFLSIALLLRHTGFHQQARSIRESMGELINKGKHLSYDLSDRATIAQLTETIIEEILKPKRQKTIAFLATGSELLTGEVLEKNSHFAATLLHQAGGKVSTKVVVSDEEQEISCQLLQLLDRHDAVITIGGLGPTTDDRTRFAVAEATELALELHQPSWAHVKARLKKFGLKVAEANKQQALFPPEAKVIRNEEGTANACHLKWRGRDIFMLPGPPREYSAIFEKAVLPYLAKAGYFKAIKNYRYLTLGLAEGEISTEIDKVCEKYHWRSAYRWHYPYLDIKLCAEDSPDDAQPLFEVEALLKNFIVSREGLVAKEQLRQTLSAFYQPLWVRASKETCLILSEFQEKPIYMDVSALRHEPSLKIDFELSWPQSSDECQVLSLTFVGFYLSERVYQHQISTPKREAEIEKYIQNYFAWQLNQFIQSRRDLDAV